MTHKIDTSKKPFKTRQMSGRRLIKSSESEITRFNVCDVLRRAMSTHEVNQSEIDYLWKYYCGEQPVLYRQKDVRPEICNKIVENRANEIVSFEVGNLCGEPIQYASRRSDDRIVEQINLLNEMMFSEDKNALDREVVEWNRVCGTAYRIVLPNKDADEEDDTPFEIFTLDPRDTFVVYSSNIGNKPLMAVKYSIDDNNITRYSVYTKNQYFLIENDLVIGEKNHALGMIPIIEYPANNARLGAFEKVIWLLDAINDLASNRMDGVSQFIQAFWKFIGCRIDKETFDEFIEKGAIVIPPNDNGQNIDVDLIVKELNQQQSQILKDDFYNSVLTICGIPNRNGGSSTSDTGAAVIMRDGWTLAETRAKDSELIFKKSEKQMLKLVLRICKDLSGFDLKLRDIDMKFTRRNYEAIQSKSQVLISMLQQPKIHPRLAFLHSGLFTDAESAYTMSMEYYEEQRQLEESGNGDEVTEPVAGFRLDVAQNE